MKLLKFVIFFFIATTAVYGQESPADTLKPTLPAVDSAQLINKAKDTAKEAVRDSLGVKVPALDTAKLTDEVKSTAKQAAEDSLYNYVNVPDVKLDSTLVDQAKQEGKQKVETAAGISISTDSASVKSEAKKKLESELGTNIPTDSSAVKQEASKLAKDEFKHQTGVDAPDVTLDSTTMDQLKTEAESRAEGMVKDTDEFKALEGSDSELGELSEIKEEVEKTQQQLKEQKARKELKQKMASQAKDYISEHAEEIQQVQSQMGELKQKYSYVPNSNDLSTAKKRSSLKGESFWKRLVLGGNFNVSKTNPINIDLSPVLGWKFNKLFEAGITGAYRAKFGADNSGVNTFENEEVYGYSIFANHMVFKNFFAYLEGENMSKVTGTNEGNSRKWNQSLLVGIGRKFKIAKFLEMQAIVTYNFLHDNSDGLYGSPVVFKTGFRIVK